MDEKELAEMIQKQAKEMQEKMMAEMQNALSGSGMSQDMIQSMIGNASALASEYSDILDQLDDDEEEDEEFLREFLQENRVTGENAKYMPIGALLIGTHGEHYETLALMQDRDYTEQVLEGGWGIDSRKEGLKMLESLLGGRHANKFKPMLEAIRSGNIDKVDEDDLEDYELSVQGITEALDLPMSLVDGCTTLIAWDLERIGYLVRLFVNMDYLSEDEAWEWMKKAAAEIKKNFSSWEEYIVSLLLGRGFAMGVAPEPYAVALDMLTDRKDFLESNPISGL